MAHFNDIVAQGNVDIGSLVKQARGLDTALTSAGGNLNSIAGRNIQMQPQLGDVSQTQQFKDAETAAWQSITDKVNAAAAASDKYQMTLQGNTLGIAQAEITKQYDAQKTSLDAANKALADFMTKYKAYPAIISTAQSLQTALNTQLGRAGSLRDQENAKAVLTDALLQKQLEITSEIAVNSANATLLKTQQQYNNGILYQIQLGTSAGQIVNQTATQQIELNAQILASQQSINTAQEKLLKTDNPTLIAQLNAQIAAYQKVKDTSVAAQKQLSASAVAANQLFQTVGSTLETGVVDGISDIIDHAGTLQQVMTQVWQSLTQAAVKYLLQLVEVYAEQQLIAGASGSAGGIGGFLGGLFGIGGGTATSLPGAGFGASLAFAKGGVFDGQVTPFASGGVIGGPTLFGLAGEAGSEAIMPLTRIGGKLGVHAGGMGGSTQNVINISAIDTQSGVGFITKHANDIQSALTHQGRLNRGKRTLP